MSTIDSARRTHTIRATDSVGAASRVRHVDQLDEPTRERFYELLESGSVPATASGTSFVDGEVIVFTDYYRIDIV